MNVKSEWVCDGEDGHPVIFGGLSGNINYSACHQCKKETHFDKDEQSSDAISVGHDFPTPSSNSEDYMPWGFLRKYPYSWTNAYA